MEDRRMRKTTCDRCGKEAKSGSGGIIDNEAKDLCPECCEDYDKLISRIPKTYENAKKRWLKEKQDR